MGGRTGSCPQGRSNFDAIFREWMEASPRKFFVAEDGGELVGMLNLMIFERMPKPGTESSRWVYLGNAYVLPEFRNAGIGGRLVDASIQFSQSIKAVRMVLSPSVGSRNFYARLGFEPAGELNILRF
ncbi:GNAT family N-acetyltransferase [Arthrobacter sp. NPDC056886]|uniref:GNAT family N-acetyltransferase n=1 Tax=Arthrobacter sp. NPDC056886 TaxID=3345960 RepID=UPI0036710B72